MTTLDLLIQISQVASMPDNLLLELNQHIYDIRNNARPTNQADISSPDLHIVNRPDSDYPLGQSSTSEQGWQQSEQTDY